MDAMAVSAQAAAEMLADEARAARDQYPHHLPDYAKEMRSNEFSDAASRMGAIAAMWKVRGNSWAVPRALSPPTFLGRTAAFVVLDQSWI
jgi:hypothetical protein